MKVLQKGVSIALTVTLVASLSTGALAQSAVPNTEQAVAISAPITAPNTSTAATDSVVAPIAAPTYLQGEAVVKAIYEYGRVLVVVNDIEIAMNTSEETFVLDAKTGLPGDLGSLKVGDLLYVYYSPAMTRSIPAQSFATAIITQVEKDKAHPAFFTVKDIVSRSENEVRVLNEAGDLVATISKDMPIAPFKTKQIVTLQDISVGSQLFIWYDIVALSYPGQTHAKKTVFIAQSAQTPELGVKPVLVPKDSKLNEKICINGNVMSLGKLNWQVQNGHVMVPLRVVAEALGFKVTWDGSIQGAHLDDGTVKTTVILGQDAYYKASSKAIGLTQNFEFGTKSVLVGNSMYVPVELFNLLYSNNSAVELLQ